MNFSDMITGIAERLHSMTSVGVVPAVATNLLAHERYEECLTYLLGVEDVLAGIGSGNAVVIRRFRTELKDAIR